MALYLGRDLVKINIDGITYSLNLFSSIPILNGIILLSSEGYILKDSNYLFLTAKESE